MDTRMLLLWGRNLSLMILAIVGFIGMVSLITFGPRLLTAGFFGLVLLSWLCYCSYDLAKQQRTKERREADRVMELLKK